jgi:hypothetical protein
MMTIYHSRRVRPPRDSRGETAGAGARTQLYKTGYQNLTLDPVNASSQTGCCANVTATKIEPLAP